MRTQWIQLCALAAAFSAGHPASAHDLRAGERLVEIVHADGHRFGGTFVLPNGAGPFPAALLVSPAGDHPRDELRTGGHHWAELAQTLAGAGIASLRVDNRGIGASTSDARPEWSWEWTSLALAGDLRGHLAWLSERAEIDRNRVGVIAHGDGTLPAAHAAAENRGLAFAVLLSAPGLRGSDNLVQRQLASLPPETADRAAIESALLAAMESLASRGDTAETREHLQTAFAAFGLNEETAASQAAAFAGNFGAPYYREWFSTDPSTVVARVELPVLVLCSTGDERADGAQNAGALETALRAGNAFHARVELLDGFGHFLEEGDERRLAEPVERRIVDWIADTSGLCREDLLPRTQQAHGEVWICNVSVVDVRAGALDGPFDVRVSDGRVAALAPPGSAPEGNAAEGVVRVDGDGRFLAPGLWDMHGHLTFWGGDALALLATSGVTGVRDMGGDLAQIARWRASIDANELFGPRIAFAGSFLDGPKPNFQWRVFAQSEDDGQRAVHELAARGVDFIKVHSKLPRPALEGAASAARELGLSIAGHVPYGISPFELEAFGYTTLEHANSLLSALAAAHDSPAPGWTAAYEWWCSEDGERAMAAWAAQGLCVTPTLAIIDESLPYMNSGFEALEPWLYELTRRLHAAGVPLLAGTDFARRSNGVEPGASLVHELELLTRAGLTPAETLQAATLNAALALGRTDLGTVEVDAVADLILLDEDPLQDVGALRELGGVCLGGRWYDATELSRIRSQAYRAGTLHDGEVPATPVQR